MKPQRLDSLTSLRFFAALLVVVHHSRAWWAHSATTGILGRLGWLGVTFFFVLSGFVIMWGWQPQPYREFVLRRGARIYPLHLLMLAVVLVLYGATGHVDGGYVGTRGSTLANAALLQSWYPLDPTFNLSWNSVSWSLSCELFFYLVAPSLFAWMATRDCRRIAGALWLLMLAASIYVLQTRDIERARLLLGLPLLRLPEFILGAAAAVHLRRGGAPLRASTGALLCVLALALGWWLLGVPRPGSLTAPVYIQLFALPCALLIYGVAGLDARGARSWLRNRHLVFLGDCSFALYMTHAVVLPIYGRLIAKALPAAQQSIAQGEIVRIAFMVCAVALSCFAYVAFETPVRRMLLATIGSKRYRASSSPRFATK